MPDHWQLTTLGEVAEVNPKELPLPEDAPFVPMDAVNAGQRWVEYIEPRGKRSGARARAGDVLFARITPCLENGKTAQVQPEIERCGGSTEFIVLRGSDRLDPDFLYVWATDRSVRKAAASLMTGSTGRQRLSAKDLAAMSLALPPVREQRRIVDFVESIDSCIDCLQTQVEVTRAARSALLADLLSNPGDDWVSMLLGDAFDIRMGRQRSPKNASGSFMVDYLRAANIKDGKLLLDDVKRMNFAPEEQITFRLEPGDVLVTEGSGSRNEVGASARWDSEIAGVVCFQNTLLRMRRVDGVSSSGFAEVIARYFYSSGRWADVASGTNIFHIGAKRAENMLIDLPPLERQGEIVDAVSALDQQLYALERQVASVRAFRSGVLSELLSGERLLDESYDVAVSL